MCIRDSPEVEGILGHAGNDAQVVSCAADANALPLKGKVGLVVQTTQTAQNLAEVVAAITPRVQELRVINTICAATSERQQAAATLAKRCDCMVVVGGKNSGNTRRLAQICADACEHTPVSYTHLVRAARGRGRRDPRRP